MMFFLSEGGGFSRKLGAVKEADGPDLAAFSETAKDVQKYLGIKTLVSFITGLLAGLYTWWLGLDFALLWEWWHLFLIIFLPLVQLLPVFLLLYSL